jgi:hypothetical protein
VLSDAREGGSFRTSLTYEQPTGTGKTTAHTDTYHGRFVELVPTSSRRSSRRATDAAAGVLPGSGRCERSLLTAGQPVLKRKARDLAHVTIAAHQGAAGGRRCGGDSDVEIGDRAPAAEERGLDPPEVASALSIEGDDGQLAEEGRQPFAVRIGTGRPRGAEVELAGRERADRELLRPAARTRRVRPASLPLR